MSERTKVDSELHTVASAELQKEIDATLKKLKEQNESPVQHDGERSNSTDPESK